MVRSKKNVVAKNASASPNAPSNSNPTPDQSPLGEVSQKPKMIVPPRKQNAEYKRPDRSIFSDWWQWYKSEWAFGMMENWEIALVHFIVFTFFALLYIAVRQYMPDHLRLVGKRMRWYIFGVGEPGQGFEQVADW